MSSSTLSRRPRAQRLGPVGIGTAVLLVGIASPAAAALQGATENLVVFVQA